MTNIKPIKQELRDMLPKLLDVPITKVPVAAYTCKKCFKADVGFNGTVFAAGDTVIILVDGQETLIKLQGFFSVNSGNELYSLLGQGVSYPLQLTENGVPDTNYWSGFLKVEYKPDQNSILFFVKDICRKVILYPSSNENLLTVVDYMRHFRCFPYELIVPVYPELGDMALIQGESNEDVWHGHILSVDCINQMVDVYFFVPNRPSCLRNREANRVVYVREIQGRARGAKNTVAWQSIIGIAEGHWNNPSQWIKAG